MPDHAGLRVKAREAVQDGKLPARRPDRTLGGLSKGSVCAICDAPVKPDQMVFEVEYDPDDPAQGVARYDVHPRCLVAWEFERTKVGPRLPI